MENLCHTLTGWVIARAGIGRLSPLATSTCIVAANLPDADVVSLAWGDLVYLEHHRGVTHSLPGLAAQAVLLPLVMWAGHRLVARGRPPDARPKLGVLALASACGLASHFLLDWTNSYGVRPWLPFDRTWWYGDLVYIVDPWLWLILASALCLGSKRTTWALAGWGALFAVLGGIVVVAGLVLFREVVGGAVWFWLAALMAVLVAWFRVETPDPARLARGALGVYLGYGVLLFGAHRLAVPPPSDVDASSSLGAHRAHTVDALPLPMRPDRWRRFYVYADSIRWADYDVLRGEQSGGPPVPIRTHLETPEARAALATCPGALARHFSRYLRAQVTTRTDGVTVEFVDERFPTARGRRTVGYIPVELGPDLAPKPDPRSCPEL
jgi:inner membrane protein